MESLANVANFVIYDLGLVKRWQRFAFFGGVVAAAQYAVKPGYAYEEGVPRPWIILSNGEDNAATPTYVPWYLPSILTGAAASVFI